MVVPKNAAESFAALNLAIRVADILLGIDELVVETLVVALFVIMVHERGGRSAERVFAKQNHLFIRSIKEECLDRVIPLGEAHLRELIHEYVAHYHVERPHQGLAAR